MTKLKLASHGYGVAVAIRDRVTFDTYGSLHAENVNGLGPWDSGRLEGPDHEKFREDMGKIDYVVYSYNTPIAWHADGHWHKVAQKFSVTTSKHQGKLYLIND